MGEMEDFMDLKTIFRVNDLCLNCKKMHEDRDGIFYCRITGLVITHKDNEESCEFEEIR